MGMEPTSIVVCPRLTVSANALGGIAPDAAPTIITAPDAANMLAMPAPTAAEVLSAGVYTIWNEAARLGLPTMSVVMPAGILKSMTEMLAGLAIWPMRKMVPKVTS
jgi:hypothetical protein